MTNSQQTIRAAKAAPRRPTVRVVHPAGSLVGHEERIYAGLRRLEKHGCTVRWAPERCDAIWREYYAGPDETRADEFIAAVTEPEVDIVWMARGGSGCGRIVERICDALRTVEPKIVIGFSDGTSILNALAQHLGWITFHGPVITALSDPDVDDELDDCLAILQGQKSTIGFESNSIERMEGRLFGGNLTVLASSIGQQYGLRHSQDALWLLEDVGEAPYRLERAFCQLKNAGIFKSAKGLLLGDLDLPLLQCERITDGFAHDSELPVISQIPAGHRGRNACLPIGARLYADGGLGTVTALEPWVISR